MKLPNRIPEKNRLKLPNGSIITYRSYGKGYPVIAFPAWMTSSLIFLPLSKELDNIKLICPDIPGWGNNHNIGLDENHIDHYTEVMGDFIKGLDIKDYSVLGYSFGGVIVQSMLQNGLINPQKVALISTLNGGYDVFNEKKFRIAFNNKDRIPDLSRHVDKIKKIYVFISKIHIAFSYLKNSNLKFVDMMLRDVDQIDINNVVESISSLYGRTFLSPKLKRSELLLLYVENDHDSVKKGMKYISKYTKKDLVKLKKLNHHHLVFKPEGSSKYLSQFFTEGK
jgi:pimeloyl-ACP methyl ester carboxylesterase